MKFRPAWKQLCGLISSVIDLGDVIYASGVMLIAVGAGWFHVGAGFVAAGMGTVFPFVLQMLRSGIPPKGKP